MAVDSFRARLARFIAPRTDVDPEKRALNSGNLWPSFGVFDAGRTLATLSPRAAFSIPGVSAAVQLVSQEIATIPLKVFNVEGDGMAVALRHPAYNLLRWSPNPLFTARQWRETAQIHVCLWGNSFTEIVFDSAGRPRELWLLHPEKVDIMTDGDGREIMYMYQPQEGGPRMIPPDRILHIRWLTSGNGLWGESPVLRCSDAIGLTHAAAEFSAKFYGSGAHLSGVLSHPGSLSETSFEALKQSWKESHEGNKSAHSVAILEEGMSWTPTSVNPEDGQMLPTREFQIREVARIFGVPVFRIGGASDTNTYSNIEQETIAFYRNSMRPIFTNWEQEIDLKLLGRNFRSDFDLTDVLRPDVTTRYNGYSSGIAAGWLLRSEVRKVEGLTVVSGIDEENTGHLDDDDNTGHLDDQDDDEARAFLPILTAVIERVLTRQRRALEGAENGKVEHYFETQPTVWADALRPVFESAVLAGVEVPGDLDVEIGGRFAELHAAEWSETHDATLLWNAEDLAEEILDGLR